MTKEIIFGFGNIAVVLGTSEGAPAIGFKKIDFGLKTGEEIPDNVTTAALPEEAVLRFFNKESLIIVKKALDRLVEKYDEIDKPEKTMTFWVEVISGDDISTFKLLDAKEGKL